MHRYKVTGLLVLLYSELCLTIRVPTVWTESGNSAVNNEPNQVEIIQPQNVQTLHQLQPIPIEYFQYTAPKPQFAVDIAAYHGVNNPQEQFKAHPIMPVSEEQKPVLGIHQMLNQDQTIYHPYQNYVKKGEKRNNYVQPISTGYEIFHPYVAEQPALQQLYKDPTLTKIRNDLKHTKDRLQAYEEQAGQPNISDGEYLEGQEKTDKKLFPQKNIPARYEIHKAERRPIYYQRPHADSHREQILNKKFKHPWNQQNIKIRPLHYKPIKNHIHNLRQQHAMKYDDERNEYPQIIVNENSSDPEEGQDIYEAGKQKYTQLRDDFDLSINKAKQLNRPVVYQNLELQKNEPEAPDVEDEFIPIKNYAQVRKSETFKHVPRKAAFDDAETFEEILNAPRLREAIKSSKAQIVYSEEGYEDSAYDHAGEQKHASNHEGHGGFLKQKENSSGLYKIPKVLDSYQDGRESEYRDNTEHAETWKNNNKDNEEESETDDYSKEEYNKSVDADINSKRSPTVTNRSKREQIKTLGSDNSENATKNRDNNHDEINENNKKEDAQHEVDKRETNFEVPEINLDSTLLTENEIIKMSKLKFMPKMDTLKDKYPYYYKTLKQINKDSPLRYAENLNHIPKKSDGGTEFYDSRSNLECPEVESDVDPIPEKLKNDDNPTDEDNKGKDENENKFNKQQRRLNGLGDKIDCFKAKYFGENPLDSPFFKEEIIASPEPIIIPKLSVHKRLKINNEYPQRKSQFEKDNAGVNADIFELIDKLRLDTNKSRESLNISISDIKPVIVPKSNIAINSTQQSDVYADVLTNINSNIHLSNVNGPSGLTKSTNDETNLTYNFYQNKEEVTKQPQLLRKKRSTPFIYEPYKIIKDSQLQDSKKTTTTSNISPLIRQLQSSRVVDRVSRSNREEKQTRPGVSSRSYVDIGKKDRDKSPSNPTIVDVSIDQRRGEPRYEIRPQNHRSEYTPVQNKRTMSVEDYKTRTEVINSPENVKKQEVSINRETRNRLRSNVKTTIRPYYDVSSFLPSTKGNQNVAESNSNKNSVTTTKPHQDFKTLVNVEQDSAVGSEESEEDYDDEDEDEEDQVTTVISTTTTPKPSFRRRTKDVSTTENPKPTNEDEPERLRLITRFRNYKPREKVREDTHVTEPTIVKKYDQDITMPKYREKKKKSSESTLVTDTKKYGDDVDEDDMRKEVDALIGVQHDMDDYTPLYEKEEEQKGRKYHHSRKNDEENREINNNDENDEERIPDDDGDDEDEEDDDDDDDEDDEDEEEYEEEEDTPVATTPEPTKRTLVRTTDAPSSTVASYEHTTATPSRASKSEIKPIITRKKIEIHKELPVNRSSPHVTQFTQDIKEVEIIKESPVVLKKKPHKKGEALELYKDDNLAKDVNKLGDVEIFNENIDLDAGRKHGGNYRKATKEDLRLLSPQMQESQKTLKDTETSQSENQKHVEFDQYTPQQMHGGNFKSISDIKRTTNSGRNAKLVELSESPIRSMHGGNLKVNNRKRGGRRNEKLIELDEHHDVDRDSSQDDDYKSSPHNPRTDRLHGGNYRSGKLIAYPDKENDDIKARTVDRDARKKAAALLNSYAQAVPVLTTTPAYILDPSKRMYYYVDA